MNIRHWALTLRPFLVLLSLCMYGSAIAADQSPQGDLQATMREVFQPSPRPPWSLTNNSFRLRPTASVSMRHYEFGRNTQDWRP
jgi:hypothetical protein